ncbi:hypothetical protein KC319_g68 [Hortaea werneckii]|nr:hypothetical protein KC319_g68 [Hortaea werneckii]
MTRSAVGATIRYSFNSALVDEGGKPAASATVNALRGGVRHRRRVNNQLTAASCSQNNRSVGKGVLRLTRRSCYSRSLASQNHGSEHAYSGYRRKRQSIRGITSHSAP